MREIFFKFSQKDEKTKEKKLNGIVFSIPKISLFSQINENSLKELLKKLFPYANEIEKIDSLPFPTCDFYHHFLFYVKKLMPVFDEESEYILDKKLTDDKNIQKFYLNLIENSLEKESKKLFFQFNSNFEL